MAGLRFGNRLQRLRSDRRGPCGGRSARRARGFVLVTMMLATVVMLGCIGLAIDAGYLQFVKTRMQTAADAAAIGGVQENRMNGSSGVQVAARADSSTNGFTHLVASVFVTVNMPPASGFYTTDPTAVEVIITQSVAPFFLQLLGVGSTVVTVRSVARQGSGSSCLYTLDPSASNAFSVSGGVNVQVGCGIVVDSSSGTALSASGGAHVTANSINIVGNYSSSGGATLSPSPNIHATAQNDPLAYVPAPSVGACNYNNYSVSGGAVKAISPGVYCNGISISGGSTVTLSAGTYILLGGGLSLSGGSTLTGTGVTFYNTAGSGHTYGAISLSGGTNVQLSAPTSGSLAGMLFFQDRTIASGVGSSLSGGTSTVFSGALYFPTTSLSYSGGAASNYTIIVSKTISFSGGATLNADYSTLSGGSPVKGGASLGE